jgi:flagellar hook-associated protein 2
MVTTTSATSSNAATASILDSASKAAKANVVSKLGGGSGIDTQSLASSLVDAERAPRQAAIDRNIKKNEAIVSGMAALKYVLNNLKTAFDDLKDVTDFKSIVVSNSNTSAFNATASSSASVGSHTVEVTALAAAQRTAGTVAFASTTSSVNGGMSMALTLGGTAFSGGTTISIAAGDDTPQGIVDAINTANVGLSAYLVNTGDASTPYKVVVAGTSGADNAFTITASDTSSTGGDIDSGFAFSSTNLQEAADAAVTVDGISVTSASNTVTEAVPGLTLVLKATNSGSAAAVDLSNDTSVAKGKVTALVTAYNDANALMDEVSNAKSTMDTYGGTLVGNSTVRTLRDQLRATVLAVSDSAPSTSLSYFHDIGVELDKSGKLTINTVKLDLAFDTDFDNTVTLLSGDQQDLSVYDTTTAAGIAGDASRALYTMLKSNGTVTTESANATSRISDYKDDLAKLDDRMTRLLEHYTKQFAAMDSIVGQTKSTQTGLTSSFAGLMAMYTNK